MNNDFRDGQPVGLTMFLDPIHSDVRVFSQALYVQDQWTIDRVTLNLGLRYDHFHSWSPPLRSKRGRSPRHSVSSRSRS